MRGWITESVDVLGQGHRGGSGRVRRNVSQKHPPGMCQVGCAVGGREGGERKRGRGEEREGGGREGGGRGEGGKEGARKRGRREGGGREGGGEREGRKIKIMFKIYSILLLCFILCVHFHTWNISLNSLTATPDRILTSPYLGAPTPCAEMWVLPLCDILRIHMSKANPVRSGFKPPREVDWLNAHSIRIGERWGKAANKELRTYQPSGKWSLATIYQVSNFTTSTTGKPRFGHIETPAKRRHPT